MPSRKGEVDRPPPASRCLACQRARQRVSPVLTSLNSLPQDKNRTVLTMDDLSASLAERGVKSVFLRVAPTRRADMNAADRPFVSHLDLFQRQEARVLPMREGLVARRRGMRCSLVRVAWNQPSDAGARCSSPQRELNSSSRHTISCCTVAWVIAPLNDDCSPWTASGADGLAGERSLRLTCRAVQND